MIYIYIIFVSFVFSSPPSFNLDRSIEFVDKGLPDNGIIDIEAISKDQIYFGTSSGLGRLEIDGEELNFSTVNSSKSS